MLKQASEENRKNRVKILTTQFKTNIFPNRYYSSIQRQDAKPHQLNTFGHSNRPFYEIINYWIGIKINSSGILFSREEKKPFPLTLASLPKKTLVAHLPASAAAASSSLTPTSPPLKASSAAQRPHLLRPRPPLGSPLSPRRLPVSISSPHRPPRRHEQPPLGKRPVSSFFPPLREGFSCFLRPLAGIRRASSRSGAG